ncbi:NRDE family protein [Halomonas sediminis]
MCLIAFAWQPDSPLPLRLIANRDEFHARPAAALSSWPDAPHIVGGRDLEAGGTWLAVNRQGRVAALTNVRDPLMATPLAAPSRGALVRQALECKNPSAWLQTLAENGAQRYAGFNLLVGDQHALWHLHRGRLSTHLQRVTPGVHGLSNADLDTPWPKLTHVCQRLSENLNEDLQDHWPDRVKQAIQNTRTAPLERLPDTGIELILEQQLSAAFILGETYGTRATTWLSLHGGEYITITEESFGPSGTHLGEIRLKVPINA